MTVAEAHVSLDIVLNYVLIEDHLIQMVLLMNKDMCL